MTTATLTLTDFLLARIAEDEVFGRATHPDPTVRDYAARVLAECEAKRRIVEWATDEFHQIRGPVTRRPSTFEGNVILHVLAAIYSNHADYRSEWAV